MALTYLESPEKADRQEALEFDDDQYHYYRTTSWNCDSIGGKHF